MDFKKRDLDAIGIIPARMDSTRLPGKMLKEINGKPLVLHTYDNAKTSEHLRRIVIATDHEDIKSVCEYAGAEVVMTRRDLPSGTDRIHWAYKELEESADVVVNIQGDEPLLSGKIIDELFWPFSTSLSQVGTLVKRIDNIDDVFDSSVVKVVLENDNTALYFSRSPIPFVRDTHKNDWLKKQVFWKHIGVYAYRIEALEEFTNLPQTDLEISESLEQLRLLQSNHKYLCVETKEDLHGVDTQEDLDKLQQILSK